MSRNSLSIKSSSTRPRDKSVKLWVDEGIWGHRFYNDQTPWTLLLEFLAVFRSRLEDGCALNEKIENDMHENICYSIPKLIGLRKIIFNAPYIQHIVETESTDEKRWEIFFQRISQGNNRRQEFNRQELKDRFRNFSEMNQVIKLFQNTSVEAHRNRRWTSRFLFPYGKDCIYSDLREDKNLDEEFFSSDRRFFARGGELLYLMLCRCDKRTVLKKEISQRIFTSKDTIWSRLIKALILAGDSSQSDMIRIPTIGYLPYEEHSAYNVLAQDWLTILQLRVPDASLLEPLMRISALHMLVYMLQRSLVEIGRRYKPRFVMNIPSPKKSNMLELSKRNFDENRSLSRKAISAYIDKAKDDKQWKEALKSYHGDSSEVREYLQERFKYSGWEKVANKNPDDLIQELKEYALKRHNQHVYKVHQEWGREIGLVVARRGVGTWYSPTDDLIKTLVITNVDKRDEYRQFLKNLYERYGFVIGVQEAKEAYGKLPIDERDLDENSRRLEHRLKTLGLLNRLSDDCAYVENPFVAHE